MTNIFLYLFQGVMEAIRISCAGFPTRKVFVEFVSRFRILAPEVKRGGYIAKPFLMFFNLLFPV